MMVLFMYLKVLRKISDPMCQKANLYLRGTGVVFVQFKLLNQIFFLVRC